MGVDIRAMELWEKKLKRTINQQNRVYAQMAKEDAKVLKEEIKKSFEENHNVPLHGYRLVGSGSATFGKTDAYWDNYEYDWQPPRVTIQNHPGGLYVTASGRDVWALEYGSGTDGENPDVDAKNPYWIYNSDQGYAEAHNDTGGGNWYRAIEIRTGNQFPLISKGEVGSRFFSTGNEPTYFVSKAVDSFNEKVQSNSSELKLTKHGVAGYIEKQLTKI